MLENFFRLTEHKTSVRTEVIAGITTFLTMAYIIFVNPTILGDDGHGPRRGVRRHLPGGRARHRWSWACSPTSRSRMAPGMGLNAYFAFTVVLAHGLHLAAGAGRGVHLGRACSSCSR